MPENTRTLSMEVAYAFTELARKHEEAVNRGDYWNALRIAAGLKEMFDHQTSVHLCVLRDCGEEER